MKIKIISILSILILLTTNTYAHSVNWSLGGIIYIYALAYGPFILICLLLAFFLPKLFKNKPKGILSSFLIRTFLIGLILWVFWVGYITLARMEYKSSLATLKDIKELSIPIKKAYISFCKENNRFPLKKGEADSVLNPIGFNRNRPQFARTEYTNNGTRLSISGWASLGGKYQLEITSELVNNYTLYFDRSCNFIGAKT